MPKCKYGKVKSGPRKGRCRKRKLSGAAARRRKGSKRRATASAGKRCRFGVVKRGRRKGQCLKVRRRRRS